MCRGSLTRRAISAGSYLEAAVVLLRPSGRSSRAGVPGRGVGAHANCGNAPAAGARHRQASPCHLRALDALEPGGRIISITGVTGAELARGGRGAEGDGARGDRECHHLVGSPLRRCRSVWRGALPRLPAGGNSPKHDPVERTRSEEKGKPTLELRKLAMPSMHTRA